jgi:hypothetical protein
VKHLLEYLMQDLDEKLMVWIESKRNIETRIATLKAMELDGKKFEKTVHDFTLRNRGSSEADLNR